MKVTTIVAKNLSDYVKYVASDLTDDEWVFRGHLNANWPLVPSIGRIKVREKSLRKTESTLFNEFKKCAVPHLKTVPQKPWDWLAMAQHHGLPTRLLDWTGNCLAAMFFAVEEPYKEDSAVWCYRYSASEDVYDLNPFSLKRIHIFRPPHITRRITSQSGCFTIHPYPFEDMISLKRKDEELIKIIVKQSRCADIRSQLDRMGINYGSIFPDLDGISKYIKWSHTLLDDE